jgi:hypothetical protein
MDRQVDNLIHPIRRERVGAHTSFLAQALVHIFWRARPRELPQVYDCMWQSMVVFAQTEISWRQTNVPVDRFRYDLVSRDEL